MPCPRKAGIVCQMTVVGEPAYEVKASDQPPRIEKPATQVHFESHQQALRETALGAAMLQAWHEITFRASFAYGTCTIHEQISGTYQPGVVDSMDYRDMIPAQDLQYRWRKSAPYQVNVCDIGLLHLEQTLQRPCSTAVIAV